MSGGPAIVVRADASVAIGLGHAMRCLALAQALADEGGGRAVFLLADPPPALAARLLSEGVAVQALRAAPGSAGDAGETAATGAGWAVLDGYHLGGAYQAAVARAGPRVLALDDDGQAGDYEADLVLDQNLGADGERYARRAPQTKLLLGPRYALLRREFRTWTAPARTAPAVARRVLVTLGGSDPDNATSRVIALLGAIAEPLEVQVLVGGANPHRAAVRRAAAASPHAVDVVVDARDMPARMAWADLALSAAGGTARELARVGTPQATVVLAENQRAAGDALVAAGVAILLGSGDDAGRLRALLHDRAARAEQSRRGPELVDGHGARRVLTEMGLAA